MNLAEYPFLADENIHPDVIAYLRDLDFDMISVIEAGLIGSSDEPILQFAFAAGRVVLTHDSDFGTLALAYHQPIVGILYVRPGHIQPSFTIDTLTAILNQTFELEPPFVIVGTRRAQKVHIRARQL